MKLRATGEPRGLWIVAYDIVDDRRRARIARLLERNARRIQKSVFEALASLSELRLLAAEVAERAHTVEDRVDFLPLCPQCAARRRRLGQALPPRGDTTVV